MYSLEFKKVLIEASARSCKKTEQGLRHFERDMRIMQRRSKVRLAAVWPKEFYSINARGEKRHHLTSLSDIRFVFGRSNHLKDAAGVSSGSEIRLSVKSMSKVNPALPLILLGHETSHSLVSAFYGGRKHKKAMHVFRSWRMESRKLVAVTTAKYYSRLSPAETQSDRGEKSRFSCITPRRRINTFPRGNILSPNHHGWNEFVAEAHAITHVLMNGRKPTQSMSNMIRAFPKTWSAIVPLCVKTAALRQRLRYLLSISRN